MKIWDPLYSVEEADKIIVGFGKEADILRKYFNKTFTYSPLHKKDLFDMKTIDLGNLTFADFEKEFQKNTKAQWIFLGGDHAVTPNITKIVKPKSLLSLDAHLDLVDVEKSEYKNPHAQAMRDVSGQNVQVSIRGYRTCCVEEENFAKENNIDVAFDLNFNKKIDYLSIDLDVLDPIYVETSTPEALGFKPEQVIEIIRKTKPQFADIVEWSPPYGYAYVVALFKELLYF